MDRYGGRKTQRGTGREMEGGREGDREVGR